MPAETLSEKVVTAQRILCHVPMPVGFKHTLRLTSSKPLGWVQYEAECPVHNCTRTADRIAKLADIFKGHAQCRQALFPLPLSGMGHRNPAFIAIAQSVSHPCLLFPQPPSTCV